MSKAILGVDVDNVCCNTGEAVINYYNKLANDNLSLSDVKSYYAEKYVKDWWKDKFYKLFLDSNVWKSIAVIDGCKEVIDKLYDEDYRIIFVTSTEPYNAYKKTNWLSRLFPQIDMRDSFISIKDKQLLSNIDLLFDDYPENLANKIDKYGNRLFAKYKKVNFTNGGTYLWTQDFQCDGFDSFKANTWNEFYDIVHKLF